MKRFLCVLLVLFRLRRLRAQREEDRRYQVQRRRYDSDAYDDAPYDEPYEEAYEERPPVRRVSRYEEPEDAAPAYDRYEEPREVPDQDRYEQADETPERRSQRAPERRGRQSGRRGGYTPKH